MIPLVEVVGNGANVPPGHIGVTAANVGVVLELTVITKVVVVAH